MELWEVSQNEKRNGLQSEKSPFPPQGEKGLCKPMWITASAGR
ncbi:hypothetical protein SB6411_04933 [Klebsiella spallanzanii]|uniref:Uncharacterized protein n=1 Tax=Klebsiella spallanzanii TaxID=2587528 RepID=A0A564NTX2_9ENTR|nr:hypothetical protein SB6411_04933 [Klebsiella spallanzanii]VUS71359.1 hypothetical protein SB6419_01121 [Klebsiella spallanzanii]VUT09598.1 hypothetical protein SB6408_02801 [Klebsiella spallanzanii]